jgi:hypothetical protein
MFPSMYGVISAHVDIRKARLFHPATKFNRGYGAQSRWKNLSPVTSLAPQGLSDRNQAVRRAGCIEDDQMFLSQLVVVAAEDNRQVGAVGWSRDDDALGAGGQVQGSLVERGEDAGAAGFDDGALLRCGRSR